ncbi:MAG: ribosome small subunit-dependent GTPase A [Bacteroidaceae bacterium]|nr:ribosome small subunit-dependent GTPase A [Bacteroidaceae bacterium]
MTKTGTIIKNTGSWYVVRTLDKEIFDCKVKGNFRLKGIRSTNPVAVGDNVKISLQPDGNTALIEEIVDRKNYVIRKASNLSKQSHIIAANVDIAMLVVTVAHPETSTTFIDRFLASAEAYRIPVTLVFNKIDLLNDEETHYLDAVINLYENIGYSCLKCSAQTGHGIEEGIGNSPSLRELLKDKVTLLSGNSGVGKSTLLNRLIPDAKAKTSEISSAHDTGQHTTTFSQMFDLPEGGNIIDTPGIKGFGTFDMERSEVSHYFREIFEIGRDCKYGDCTHTKEPGCAVLKALEEHYISQSRYQSYLSMLDDKDETKYRQGY